jgi:hypothetical protein
MKVTSPDQRQDHTPGPWFLDEGAHGGDATVMARESGDVVDIAAVRHRVGDDQTMADAHLIAAAPDMLEALKECLLYLNNDETRDLVRAAIKKARGES